MFGKNIFLGELQWFIPKDLHVCLQPDETSQYHFYISAETKSCLEYIQFRMFQKPSMYGTPGINWCVFMQLSIIFLTRLHGALRCPVPWTDEQS